MRSPLHILLVEDEALLAMEMQMELERAGHFVCHVSATGEDAVDRVSEKRPDLILMDTRLAGKMDGIETARIILASYSVPVIFITGYSVDSIRQRAEDLHPYGYITKPVRFDALQRMMAEL